MVFLLNGDWAVFSNKIKELAGQSVEIKVQRGGITQLLTAVPESSRT